MRHIRIIIHWLAIIYEAVFWWTKPRLCTFQPNMTLDVSSWYHQMYLHADSKHQSMALGHGQPGTHNPHKNIRIVHCLHLKSGGFSRGSLGKFKSSFKNCRGNHERTTSNFLTIFTMATIKHQRCLRNFVPKRCALTSALERKHDLFH